MSGEATRPRKQWPAWIDDVLAYGPIAELESEWRASIGDAIVRVLDLRAGTIRVEPRPCGHFVDVTANSGVVRDG